MNLLNRLSGFINTFLLLLYPKRCLLCDELLVYGTKAYTCGGCTKVPSTYATVNRNLLPGTESAIDKIYPAYRYEGVMRDAMRRFKFQGMKESAQALAELIAKSDWPEDFYSDIHAADIFIPVPMHKSRLKSRGYNQAELLSRALSKQCGVPTSSPLLRIKKTDAMFGLSRAQRFDNIRDAFIVTTLKTVKSKNIFLIDDIYTTGATVEECARTLKKAGADKVFVLAFAVAVEGEDKE